MKNYLFLAVTLIMAQVNYAMNDGINIYLDTPITRDTIGEFVLPMPLEMQVTLNKWIEQETNKNILNDLTKVPVCNNIGEFTNAIQWNKSLLNGKGIENLSKHNYVFTIDKKNRFLFKIAGLGSKLRTLYASITSKDPYQTPPTSYDFIQLTTKEQDTFQDISRVAHSLRLEQARNRQSMQYVKTEPHYSFPIPGRPKTYVDGNYAIVQNALPETVVELRTLPDEQQKNIISTLPTQAIEELYEATVAAALWDVGNNLMVNKANSNELWINDLEQPNNSDGKLFYYRGDAGLKKYVHDVSVGIDDMAKVWAKIAPEKLELWKAKLLHDAAFLALCKKVGEFPESYHNK